MKTRMQRDDLRMRRSRQAREGSQAMQDYRRTQEAVRKRMAELRAERLADEAQQTKSE
jgi:hypothetical protein